MRPYMIISPLRGVCLVHRCEEFSQAEDIEIGKAIADEIHAMKRVIFTPPVLLLHGPIASIKLPLLTLEQCMSGYRSQANSHIKLKIGYCSWLNGA